MAISNYKCKICDFESKSESEMENHIKEKHTDEFIAQELKRLESSKNTIISTINLWHEEEKYKKLFSNLKGEWKVVCQRKGFLVGSNNTTTFRTESEAKKFLLGEMKNPRNPPIVILLFNPQNDLVGSWEYDKYGQGFSEKGFFDRYNGFKDGNLGYISTINYFKERNKKAHKRDYEEKER